MAAQHCPAASLRMDLKAGGEDAWCWPARARRAPSRLPDLLLAVGDDSRLIAAPVTRDLAHAFPGLCLIALTGSRDLAGQRGQPLNVGDHVPMGLVTPRLTILTRLSTVRGPSR